MFKDRLFGAVFFFFSFAAVLIDILIYFDFCVAFGSADGPPQ